MRNLIMLLVLLTPAVSPAPEETYQQREYRLALTASTPTNEQLGRLLETAQHSLSDRKALTRLVELANDISYPNRQRVIGGLATLAQYASSPSARQICFETAALHGHPGTAELFNSSFVAGRLARDDVNDITTMNNRGNLLNSKDVVDFVLKNKVPVMYPSAITWVLTNRAQAAPFRDELFPKLVTKTLKDPEFAKAVRERSTTVYNTKDKVETHVRLNSPQDAQLYFAAEKTLGPHQGVTHFSTAGKLVLPVELAPQVAEFVKRNKVPSEVLKDLSFSGVPSREHYQVAEGLPWMQEKLQQAQPEAPMSDAAREALCAQASASFAGALK